MFNTSGDGRMIKILKNSSLLLIFFMLTFSIGCSANQKNAENNLNKESTIAMQTENNTNPKYVITVTTRGQTLGDIVVELFPDKAPQHVRNFDSLVSIGFYDGTAFHRVIDGFMIQGGDPNSKDKPKNTWGFGDPSQRKIPAEFNDIKHKRGILSAARTPDPNSATSQFFIMVGDAPHLDGNYTAYGKVVSGMDVVDAIVAQPKEGSAPIDKIEMKIRKKE